ncbi:MAG: efflux RND transporter permease subunit, partial [Acidobacteriota bacterium]
MNALVTWFVRNPVASNLLMIFIVLAGLLNAALLRIEVFPDYSSDVISISVEYPGAAPEDVEEGVCLPIEETLDGLESVKKLQCIATEGRGHVAAEIELGHDIDRALNDVKSRVDALDTLPAEAEKPTIRELLLRRQVVSVVVHGAVETFSLRRLAEQLRNELVALPAVSLAQVASAPNFEIAIEVSDRQLRRYGLGFDDVVRAARDGSFELPGGAVESESNELLILTGEEARSVDAFSQVPLINRAEGGGLLLGDVAQIYDTVADSDQVARFNGQPAVMILVYRTADQNVIDVAQAVKAYAAERTDLPPGVQLSVWQDDTKELRDRLSTLVENGVAGFLLVLMMLAIFLRPKLALWVSVGLAVAFIGTVALMPSFGMSIN